MDVLACGVAAVCDHFNHARGFGHSVADQGSYCAVAQLELFIPIWNSSPDGQEQAAGDRDDSDGEIRRVFCP